MGNFQQVFGGNTIFPSDVSYFALALTADTTLEWPLEAATGVNVVARIIEVTPAAPNLSVIMPDATQTAPGQTVVFYNAGATNYTVKSSTGTTLLTVSPGLTFTLYLRDNTTPTGLWRTFQAGASTAAAQASALAGLGIIAQGSLLSQSQPVITFNANYTAGAPDRASAYVWTGALGTLTLSAASVLGNNWFMSIRNGGSGNLTIAPGGADTINGSATVTLRPGDSCNINCDGTSFYTVGLGQNPVFAFDYTSIDLTGLSGTYTLSGSELNRISYDFVGALAGNIEIIVPATTQQYWVANDTTGGSFTLTLGTATQASPVNVVRGARGIYYCQGSIVVNADTAALSSPVAIADGGTGATTASGARINLGGTTVGIGVFTAASAAAGRSALSAAASGVNNDITQLTGLTTPLSVAQGGTGVTTLTGIPKAAGTAAFVAATPGTDYVRADTTTTFSAKQVLGPGAAELGAKLFGALEKFVTSATAATGTINFDYLTQAALRYSTNAAANWTLNIRGDGTHSLDSLMAVDESVTLTFAVKQGNPAFFNNAVKIDGGTTLVDGTNIFWQGTAPVAGTINGYDIYSMVVQKTAAATFVVFASVVSFT